MGSRNFGKKLMILFSGLVITSILFGCAHTVPVVPRPPEKTYARKIPLDAGLYLTEDFKKYKVSEYRMGDKWNYTNLGESSATMFRIGLSQIFRSVEMVDKKPPFPEPKPISIQVVVEPVIEKFEFDIPFTKFQTYPARIRYHITIFDVDGNRICERSVEGIGDVKGKPGYDFAENPSKAASRAVEDGVDKSLEAILGVQELKNLQMVGKERPKGKEAPEVDRQRPEEGRQKVMASIPSVPLPKYEISACPPNASPEIKMLLGKWQGHWEEAGVPAVLIVQKIFLEENRVECIYAWAAHSISGKDREAGFNRIIGNLFPGAEPVIKFGRFEQKFNYNFVLKGKVLYGTREYPSKTYKIVMEKVE